jgi:hypothetical protein
MESNNLEFYKQYLLERTVNLTSDVPQKIQQSENTTHSELSWYQKQQLIEPTESNARELLTYVSRLKDTKALKHRYFYENLDKFLAKDKKGEFIIKPESVELALDVTDKVRLLSEIHSIKPDVIPALTISVYAAREFLTHHSIQGKNKDAILQKLKLLKKQTLQYEKETTEKNRRDGRGQTNLLGKRTLVSYLVAYAQSYKPEEHGNFEDYVTTTMVLHINNRIRYAEKETKFLRQSQGIEIENLTRVTKSPNAKVRGVEQWLPRAIPENKLKRKDWHITPLLGIPEDIGERQYQRYEWSPKPSETIATQNAIIFALTEAGFLEEEQLSNKYEGYSLHASTVFPTEILTNESMSEYRMMARALAGAYASDQRIGFGGFMSGGKEIEDKTSAGTLREVSKTRGDLDKGSHGIPKDKSLVEIRNLDITTGSHFIALQNKQFFDFAFKIAWETKLHPEKNTPLRKNIANAWNNHMNEINKLFKEYTIGNDPDTSWKELANTNEIHPEFRGKLEAINKKARREIRTVLQSTIENEFKIEYALSEPHIVLPETTDSTQSSIFIPEELRHSLALKPGDTILLHKNDKKIPVIVQKAKIRGNREIEQNPVWRVSQNVIDTLHIALGESTSAQYDAKTNTFEFKEPQLLQSEIVVDQTPRTITKELKNNIPNHIFLSTFDMERLNVKPGETITIRFGQLEKNIVVVESLNSNKTKDTSQSSWILSSNLISELGIPDTANLRMKYDKTKKTMAFGPLIGILTREKDAQNDVLFRHKRNYVAEIEHLAREAGGLVIVMNPNNPKNIKLKDGKVEGYIKNEHDDWKKTQTAFPDVIYDRDVYWINSTNTQFETQLNSVLGNKDVNISYVYPPELQHITRDKQTFYECINKNSLLCQFLPETKSVSSVDALDKFLKIHKTIFLKPDNLQQSKGVMKVMIVGNHIEYIYPMNQNGVQIQKRGIATNIEDFFQQTKDYRKNRTYIMQQYIDMAEINLPNPKNPEIPFTRGIELRVLVQRDGTKNLQVTGIVSRLTHKGLTGHEYEMNPLKALSTCFSDKLAEDIYNQTKRLAIGVTSTIEQAIGKPTGELTVDIGVDKKGNLYILEANSKAMTHGMFERTKNTDAAFGSTSNPILYATSISGFAG